MKIQGFAKAPRAGAITGTVTALLLLIGVHTVAQVRQVNSLVSVCVNQSTGAMRMLLGAAAPSPVSCSAGEQFTQWVVQTPPGAQRTARPLALNGSNSDHGLRRELTAYYQPQGSGAGNQGQGTGGNSGGSTPQNQSGAYGPNGTFVPSGAGNQGQGTGGKSGGSIPPNQRGAFGPNGFIPAPGDTVTTLYAPVQIKERTTGKMLAQIVNTGKGGRLELGDANGYMIAAIGTSPAGTGGVAVFHGADTASLAFAPGEPHGAVQILSSGQRVAELAAGKNGQMGLRIYNPAGVEVATLENLSYAPGGGGLMIHNAAGGAVAWITPNKDGTLGVVHAVTVPMPVP